MKKIWTIKANLNKILLFTSLLLGLSISLPLTAATADWGSVQVKRDENGWLKVVIENSKIYVCYRHFSENGRDQHGIGDFIIRSTNQNLVDQYIDACAYRGPLKKAFIVADRSDIKTVRLEWQNDSYRDEGKRISEVSIFPDSEYIKIDYIEYGINVVDIGRLNGTNKKYKIYGENKWKRDHVIYPKIYFDRYNGDVGLQNINEVEELGPLDYHGWVIMGVYDEKGRGFGRVMPASQTDIIKLLWNKGFEFFPCFIREKEPYSGYLFVVGGGGASEILSKGKKLADGLVNLQGYWKFEEGNGSVAVDSSINCNDGSVNGVKWTTGKMGSGLNFIEGDASVSIPVINSDALSLSAWVLKKNNEVSRANAIFNAYEYNPDVRLRCGFYLRFPKWDPDMLQFILVTEDRTGFRTQKIAQKDLGNSVAKWFHAACTYNKKSGKQKLYVDGQLVNTQTHPAENTIVPLTFLPNMKIGNSRAQQGSFQGIIDEVRLYNQALNDQPVQYLYANGTGLKGSWKFEEGERKTVTDSSGNGNYGRISSAKWTTGKRGGGLRFNGSNNYVSIPIINSEGASVAAWFYKDANDTTYSDAIFSGYKGDLDPQLREGLELRFSNSNPDKLQFVLVTENRDGKKTVKIAQVDLGDSVEKWIHSVCTYNKRTGKQKLYVNGKLADTQSHPPANTITPLTSYPDMRIGYSRNDSGYFKGIIDEVHLYERSLSFQEVLHLYDGT